jgi:hypothetical protein
MSVIDSFLTEEHEMFRKSVDDFIAKHVEPYHLEWEKNSCVDKQLYKTAAEIGILGIGHDEKYGGNGLDTMFSMVYTEQCGRNNMAGVLGGMNLSVVLPTSYITKYGTENLKQKYLVPTIAGDVIAAIAMTEPGTGSDLAAMKCTAKKEGDFYIVNGSKTFITNGFYCDYVVTAVLTDPSNPYKGMSLLIIDSNTKGYSTSKLKKLGLRSQDTAEMAFNNVKVPISNLIGEEGKGFYYLMKNLQLERLWLVWASIGSCMGIIDITLKYIREREAFGKPLSQIQVIRHKMVELQTEIESIRAFSYLTTRRFTDGENVVKEASMLKYKAAELNRLVADKCLQFFGGYGYMEEYPIARLYRDARVQSIYGGTSEIMKEIIAKIIIDDVTYS